MSKSYLLMGWHITNVGDKLKLTLNNGFKLLTPNGYYVGKVISVVDEKTCSMDVYLDKNVLTEARELAHKNIEHLKDCWMPSAPAHLYHLYLDI